MTTGRLRSWYTKWIRIPFTPFLGVFQLSLVFLRGIAWLIFTIKRLKFPVELSRWELGTSTSNHIFAGTSAAQTICRSNFWTSTVSQVSVQRLNLTLLGPAVCRVICWMMLFPSLRWNDQRCKTRKEVFQHKNSSKRRWTSCGPPRLAPKRRL